MPLVVACGVVTSVAFSVVCGTLVTSIVKGAVVTSVVAAPLVVTAGVAPAKMFHARSIDESLLRINGILI